MKELDDRSLRTTTFRLTPELCGEVYIWRGSPAFKAKWLELKEAWLRKEGAPEGPRRMPHRSLSAALTVMTGDFVHTEPRLGEDRGDIVFVSRGLISEDDLVLAFMAWEIEVLETTFGISDYVHELRPERRDLWSFWEGWRADEIIPGWWFSAASWQVVHRLGEQPLKVDGVSIQWRPDSEASLLSWDNLVYGESRETSYAAMHRLRLHPIWIPGWDDPFISIVPQLSRLTETLRYRVKNVWIPVKDGTPILRAGLAPGYVDGAYHPDWSQDAAALLENAAEVKLPPLENESLKRGLIRAIPKHHDFKCTIGKGPGQKFFEAVAHWAQGTLKEAEPYILRRTKNARATKAPLFDEAGREALFADVEGGLTIHCVYQDPRVRQQMATGVALLLTGDPTKRLTLAQGLMKQTKSAPFVHAPSGVTIKFHRVENGDMLYEFITQGDFLSWADAFLGAIEPQRGDSFLVETFPFSQLNKKKRAAAKANRGTKSAGRGPFQDPKHLMRQRLAQAGCSSQFMTEPKVWKNKEMPPIEAVVEAGDKIWPGKNREDTVKKPRGMAASLAYQPINAALDLCRGRGLFPWPMVGEEASIPAGTWLVGMTGVCRHRKQRAQGHEDERWSLAVVATQVGSRTAKVYLPQTGWVPFVEGATKLHSDLNLLTDDDALEATLDAVDSLKGQMAEDVGMVVYVDGQALRRLWPRLKESQRGDALHPRLVHERISIVRCRFGRKELPSAAGKAGWVEANDIKAYNNFGTLFQEPRSAYVGNYLFVQTSSVQRSRGQPGFRDLHRKFTRFGFTEPHMQKLEMHAASSREIQVLQPGAFDPLPLALFTVFLHRRAPTWTDGILKRPAPLHLAHLLIKDHPQQLLVGPEDPGDLLDDDE